MLESIRISNFRSCDDVVLPLGNRTIALVGKNGAGKTTLMHAIQYAAEFCVGTVGSLMAVHPRDASEPTAFELAFSMNGSRYAYRVERVIRSRRGPFTESLRKDGEALFTRDGEEVVIWGKHANERPRIGMGAATLPSLLQLLPADHRVRPELESVSKYLGMVRYHSFVHGYSEHGALSPLIERAKYEEWKAGAVGGRVRDSVQLRLLDMWLTGRDTKFKEALSILGDGGLGLISKITIDQVDTLRGSDSPRASQPSDGLFMIRFMPGTGLAGAGQWFSFSSLSMGTWRVLQIVTYLIFDEDTCMLLEQPEDSIHIGLLSRVVGILDSYSSRTQLICTTHSAKVTNLVGTSGVRLVTADNGSTRVSALTEQEKQLAGEYIRDEGTLSEFLETL